MAVTKDEILDAISKMSVMEVVELIADMEKKFNVTAAAPVAMAAGGDELNLIRGFKKNLIFIWRR